MTHPQKVPCLRQRKKEGGETFTSIGDLRTSQVPRKSLEKGCHYLSSASSTLTSCWADVLRIWFEANPFRKKKIKGKN